MNTNEVNSAPELIRGFLLLQAERYSTERGIPFEEAVEMIGFLLEKRVVSVVAYDHGLAIELTKKAPRKEGGSVLRIEGDWL